MFLFFFFFIILPFNLNAEDFPKIYGCFCEGGLITGNISSGNVMKIDNKKIEIFEEGRFIYAFGRKHKDVIKIEVNNVSREFLITDKKYIIENIRGLPRNKVEPSEKDIELSAKLVCPKTIQFLDIKHKWEAGVQGLIQLITLVHIDQVLTKKMV